MKQEMTREQKIDAGKIWQVYEDMKPDGVLHECGSKTAAIKWARANFPVQYKYHKIRVGKLIYEKKTPVQFLIEKPEGNLPCQVFAFFPEEKYNSIENGTFYSYSTIGQHSACHIDYAKECKEATKEEYLPLMKELKQIGYNLNILNK